MALLLLFCFFRFGVVIRKLPAVHWDVTPMAGYHNLLEDVQSMVFRRDAIA